MKKKRRFEYSALRLTINLKKRAFSLDLRVIAVFILAAVIFAAAYAGANRPVALYNSNPEDAENLYFTHVGLALDINRKLFSDEALSQTFPDDGSSIDILEYETAVVREIVTEDWQRDPDTENVHVGNQELRIEIVSGRYKGQEHIVLNQMSKSFDKYSKVGTRLLILVRTNYTTLDENGEVVPSITIMNYDRSLVLYIAVAVFLLITIIVGGKVGARSIIALIFTLVCVICILVPMILQGYHSVWLTLAICIYVTIISFIMLDGINRKTCSAILGTIMGFTLAACFAALAGLFARIDGLEYNVSETDSLIQAQFQGTPIYIRGTFISGIIIAALGAVMDVAMTIASSITELKSVNSELNWKQLFRSGMNIGKDAVGTMTNTLILAFTGGALVELILINLYDWDFRAIINSDLITSELITGLSGSVGLILAVPLTALIASLLVGGKPSLPVVSKRK
ncbi:MAG: YibE/F family protein [Clostridia bacterium]|nr:YibE/F family protein [Clostridia bacterium]